MEKTNAIFMKLKLWWQRVDTWIEKRDNAIALVLFLAFVCSLLPLYCFARYTVPIADDYSMMLETHEAWKATHSVWGVIFAAMQTSKRYYMTWQGSFVGKFVEALVPGLGNYKWYFLGAWCIITILVVCTFYLTKVVICEWLGGKKSVWVLGTVLLLSYQIQHMPYVYDAFYWYDGNVTYILPYSTKLFLIGLTLHLINSESKQGKVAPAVGLGVITFFITGLDYGSTGTPMLVVMLLILVYTLMHKQGVRYGVVGFAIFTITWLICVAAPGNSARQLLVGERNGVVYSIKESLFTGAFYTAGWSAARMILLSLFLLPLMISVVRNTNRKFEHPILCLIINWGIFSSLFTPRIYANYGDARAVVGYTMNYVHLMYVLLWCATLFYFVGWVMQSFVQKQVQTMKLSVSQYYLTLIVVVLIMFVGRVYNRGQYTSSQAYVYIRTGLAQQYMTQMLWREELLLNGEGKDLQVEYVQELFPSSVGGDIDVDATNWVNAAISEYYHLNSITRLSYGE